MSAEADNNMKIAVLYQSCEPPETDGIRKPMKPGGYSDSGADIVFCLQSNGMEVITPKKEPRSDFDMVFPDTPEGIGSAIAGGADTLWLNTVLYEGHPVCAVHGVYIIGQRPEDVSLYDDKFYTNKLLRKQGFSVADSNIVSLAESYSEPFPCVLKPIRGRGSQGVAICDTPEEFEKTLRAETEQGIYGNKFMAEEFLPGTEITVSVMPDGTSLPAVERIGHKNGVAPYNGDVPVAENSYAVKNENTAVKKIRKECEEAVRFLDLKALVRIDCRMDKNGEYKMFDFNLKPNLTGAGRAGRENQKCLTMLAAEALGWSYFDLLSRLAEYRWMKH